jgi:hypothetical protein
MSEMPLVSDIRRSLSSLRFCIIGSIDTPFMSCSSITDVEIIMPRLEGQCIYPPPRQRSHT